LTTIAGAWTHFTALAVLNDWRIWIFISQVVISLILETMIIWSKAQLMFRKHMILPALVYGSKNLLIVWGVVSPPFEPGYMLAAAVILAADSLVLGHLWITERSDEQ